MKGIENESEAGKRWQRTTAKRRKGENLAGKHSGAFMCQPTMYALRLWLLHAEYHLKAIVSFYFHSFRLCLAIALCFLILVGPLVSPQFMQSHLLYAVARNLHTHARACAPVAKRHRNATADCAFFWFVWCVMAFDATKNSLPANCIPQRWLLL